MTDPTSRRGSVIYDAVALGHGVFTWLCMSGEITHLKVQKKNPQRVSVYLDGRFAFGLADVEAARLRVGQHLSDAEIAVLCQRDAVEKATHKAMDLLSYRPRSRDEIRQRLSEKAYEDATVEEALERLERSGLSGDREFARYWVDNRFQFNPRGKAILRQELRQKRISDDIIEAILEDYDEEDAAARAAEAGIRRLRHHDIATYRRKLNDYLSRRGFPYAVIEPIIEEALAEHALEESLYRNGG